MLEIFTAIKLGKAILKRLKRVENRDELINTIIAAMGDGKIKPTEWAVIGKQLGVFDVVED
jgi:hypothetical protein|tara:strand:- start:9 stop:191 length:183 start_codon:yes stop_codon:yes gene_type:complete